jgi:glucose-1-phosphate thymidylyltransferase
LDAATFIESIEKRQRLKIACPEEIAWRIFIDDGQVRQIASKINESYSIYFKGPAQ